MDLIGGDKRLPLDKSITLAYEKDIGNCDFSLVQCPNCGVIVDTDYFELCSVCNKLKELSVL